MSQEQQHHHLFKEDSDEQVPGQSADEHEKAVKEEKHHKHMEELGGLGAAGTGEFALVSYLFL